MIKIKINWRLRLKNKVTLYALIAAVVNCIYTILEILNVAPQIDQSSIMQTAAAILSFLVIIGVINDPTTTGISDSESAMSYEVPRCDNQEK